MKYPIRSMITAPPGYRLLSADLSQAEAWVVAYLADEQNMKAVLNNGLIHELSARVIFDMDIPDVADAVAMKEGVSKDQRYLGKKMNHSCNYRTGPFMIAIMINKESDKPPYVTVTIKQTKEFHRKWLSFFSLDRWWKGIEETLSNNNRTLITPYRRKRMFFEEWGNSLFKEATAYIPQSTVADHMFGAIQPEVGIAGGLLGIQRKIISNEPRIRMTNTSHDSCLMEIPIGSESDIIPRVREQLLRPMMINGELCTIPVDIEIGERWGELEKVA